LELLVQANVEILNHYCLEKLVEFENMFIVCKPVIGIDLCEILLNQPQSINRLINKSINQSIN